MSDPTKDTPPESPAAQGNRGRQKGLVKFMAEFGNTNNDRFIWPLNVGDVRGAWKFSNCKGQNTTDDRFARMPDVPGHILVLDSSKERAAIYDPLSNPKNKEVLDKINEVHKATFGREVCGDPPAIYENLDENELKSWAYWARRFADLLSLRVLDGYIPTMDEVRRMPGKVSCFAFDGGNDQNKLMDLPARYIAFRPPLKETPKVDYDTMY